MKNVNLDNVEIFADSTKLPAGGYVCGITSVEDITNKEYLKFEFDIAEGEFKNYYRTLNESKGFWGGSFIKSYKEKALPFFKKMIAAFENSNKGFKFDYDEKTLRRKYIGLVLGEEEYTKGNGETGTRLYVSDWKSVDDIRKGNFTVPAKKTLGGEDPKPYVPKSSNSLDIIEDEELPWA